jgi:thymidine kinase
MIEQPKNTMGVIEKAEGLLYTLSVEDKRILDAYDFLARTNPNILFLKEEHLQPTEEQLDYYTSWHSNRYKELAKQLVKDEWDVLVIGSGMFGGKSTLSFEILDRYKEQGYDPLVLIADVMPEHYVTARSYQGKRRKRGAIKYPLQKELLDKPIQKPSIILLDEFSFLSDIESLNNLLEYTKTHNIKIVLTGLDTNYLGEPLETYRKIVENSNYKIQNLKSFIPSIDSETPIGTHTIRYVKINDTWIYDMGILPLVVSKEEEFLVHYCPATFDMTFTHNFKDKPEIKDYILFPSEELREKQNMRLKILSSNYFK